MKPLKTQLYDLNYLGSLHSKQGGLPYFLFTGKPCESCLDDRAIYAIRPNSQGKHFSFVYPGKVIDPKSKALILESRAFFGKCLPKKGDIYIVFQKEKVDRRRFLQSSVLIAEPTKDFLEETLIERRLPSIKTTLQMVKHKTCQEIPGRNRIMQSNLINIHKKSDKNDKNKDDVDDNDETDKNDEKVDKENSIQLAP